MAYLVQPKKYTISGNDILLTPPTRREAVLFREQMAAAGDDADAQEKIGVDFVAAHFKMADGSEVDVNDVPPADVVAMMKILMGVDGASVSDFTPAP